MNKSKKGIVKKIIDKKTIKVLLRSKVKHKKYGKIVNKDSVFLVDNPSEKKIILGDEVLICPIRPVSKKKSWGVTS